MESHSHKWLNIIRTIEVDWRCILKMGILQDTKSEQYYVPCTTYHTVHSNIVTDQPLSSLNIQYSTTYENHEVATVNGWLLILFQN